MPGALHKHCIHALAVFTLASHYHLSVDPPQLAPPRPLALPLLTHKNPMLSISSIPHQTIPPVVKMEWLNRIPETSRGGNRLKDLVPPERAKESHYLKQQANPNPDGLGRDKRPLASPIVPEISTRRQNQISSDS